MTAQPILIDGEFRQSQDGAGTFTATNPATRELLAEHYPISGKADMEAALAASENAARALRGVAPSAIAQCLELLASKLEERAESLVEAAAVETGLPPTPRLRDVELPRTTRQLRLAAVAVRDVSWRRIEIDSALNLRSWLEPLDGAVLVFGPNNFPFAFNGIAGGDFAAALAAGNPVIAKAHPGHPMTTRLLAEAALAAVLESGLPRASVQLLYHMPDDIGLAMVTHPNVAAVAFTGSRRGGLALKAAADAVGKPIYLELSSVNPVFILPGALEERGEQIADELSGSCALGAGQFCTNPGLSVLVGGAQADAFVARLNEQFAKVVPGTLLSLGAPAGIAAALGTLRGHGAELLTGGHEVSGGAARFEGTLLRVSGKQFLEHARALQTEAFGAVHLTVVADDVAEMVQVARALEGNLTGCVYSHSGEVDEALYIQVAAALRPRVGRLLNDKMPTGVAVSGAMHHGGPYPSTGHPSFTSVGLPEAMVRFAARRCYDAVRPARLPVPLQDDNADSVWRRIDGVWSQSAVGA